MSEMLERDVPLSEADFELIQQALQQLAKRCKQNAANSMSGYGSAASMTKRDEWLDKAAACNELENRLAEPFVH